VDVDGFGVEEVADADVDLVTDGEVEGGARVLAVDCEDEFLDAVGGVEDVRDREVDIDDGGVSGGGEEEGEEEWTQHGGGCWRGVGRRKDPSSSFEAFVLLLECCVGPALAMAEAWRGGVARDRCAKPVNCVKNWTKSRNRSLDLGQHVLTVKIFVFRTE